MGALLLAFGVVFVAELGDKTQLSTMLYAAGAGNGRWTVFFGSALALVCLLYTSDAADEL